MSELSVITVKSKSALTPPSIKDLNDVEVGQFCRAWVNFNGTGTVAIRDSFNVSSITDNGTGDYTVNFTNAMNDADYSITGCTSNEATSQTTSINNNTDRGNQTVSIVNILVGNDIGVALNAEYISTQVFGK